MNYILINLRCDFNLLCYFILEKNINQKIYYVKKNITTPVTLLIKLKMKRHARHFFEDYYDKVAKQEGKKLIISFVKYDNNPKLLLNQS